MKKTAFVIPGLTWELLADRLARHGMPAAALGGGAAGLAHLISAGKQRESINKKTNDNTLVIQVPNKTAGLTDAPAGGQYLWDAPLVAGSIAAGGAAGYKIVDSILRKHRENRLRGDLDKVKSEYAGFMGQRLANDKVASQDEFPLLSGLMMSLTAHALQMPVEPMRKQAAVNIINENKKEAATPETLLTMLTSLPGLAALATGAVAHNYYYDRQRDIDRGIQKEEADSMTKAPRFVKIVSAPPATSAEAGNKEIEKRNGAGDVSDLLSKAAEDAQGGAMAIVQKIMDPAGAAIAAGTKQDLKPAVQPEPEQDRPVVDQNDVQDVDQNTTVMKTRGGPVQVDALDPAALKALETHKQTILRSLALGMNVGE